ncbi:MAG: hypothetical protein Tsb009_01040 [Planctomycetaceae bacterium]
MHCFSTEIRWGLSAHTYRFLVCLALLMGCFSGLCSSTVQAADQVPANRGTPLSVEEEAALRKSTAVTLNYCRAAFHRIQKCPSKRVLLEEQQRVLNNLNLNRVADQEVVKLYGVVIAEISQIKIASKEQDVIQSRFKRLFRKQLVGNIVAFSAQVANGEYGRALRTGARSWWDYRTLVWDRDLDLWQVEKTRIAAIADKSALLLDTFWKLARKRQIPDRWLIRPTDLEKLDAAMRETNPRVRLRVLKRMKPFMECYPPYWYYVGRTQQELGQLFAAAKTYEILEAMGAGHFRKDELLAAGTANRAAIQCYLGQPGAEKTANRALAYSSDAWQVNLICASVLSQSKKYEAAEDALLRNLDVNLETENSLGALLLLYCHTKNQNKLKSRLDEPGTITSAAIPSLLKCLPHLKSEKQRAAITQHLQSSLKIRTDRHFGPDDLCVRAKPQWMFHTAKVSIIINGRKLTSPKIRINDQYSEVCFQRVLDLGSLIHPVALSAPFTLQAIYPDGTTVNLSLEKRSPGNTLPVINASAAGKPSGGFPRKPHVFTPGYRIGSIAVGQQTVIGGSVPNSELNKSSATKNSLPNRGANRSPEISLPEEREARPPTPERKSKKAERKTLRLGAPAPSAIKVQPTGEATEPGPEFIPPPPKRKQQ